MARIDQITIDRILDAADIVDVVGDYVDLRRRGANFMGLCPFHNERTPSFSVSRAKGICKCFSCGKGGNAVNFLMEIEQISYGEALRRLARKYGIDIKEEELSDEENRMRMQRDARIATMEFAIGVFAANLSSAEEVRSHSEEAAAALHLLEEYGLTPTTIERFRLGFTPASASSLIAEATDAGFTTSSLTDVGLLTSEGEFPWPRRLAIPLSTHFGKAVGFIMIEPADPSNPSIITAPGLLPSSELLFGFDHARREVAQTRRLILANTPLETMLLHQAGLTNTATPLSVEPGQSLFSFIRRQADEVVLLLPTPVMWNGYRRMKLGSKLLEQGCRVWTASSGRNIAHASPEELRERVENITDMVLYKLDNLQKAKNDQRLHQFIAYLTDDLLATLAAVADPLSREVYIEESAMRLAMRPGQLSRMVNDRLSRKES